MGPEPEEDPPADVTAELARAVREGDASRFAALYERLVPALYAWAAVRVPRAKTSPEDFVQEVWYRAVRNLDTEAARRHPFRAWLFVIAKNCLLETLRARIPKTSPVGGPGAATIAGGYPDSTASAAARLAGDETVQRLVALADSLDPTDRDLLIGCALEGRTATAVAVQLGLTQDQAIQRWRRLRERLRGIGWVARMLAP